MIDHLISCDSHGGQRAMLLDAAKEIGQAGVPTCDKHLGEKSCADRTTLPCWRV